MIFYKSDNRAAPTWMKQPQQRYYADCFVYCEHNPQSWPNLDAEWLELDGLAADPENPDSGVQYLTIGTFEPLPRDFFDVDGSRYIKTPCGSSVLVYPALDRIGGVWLVPVILNDEGPTLALEWGLVDGAIQRKPNTMQRDIVVTCESIRDAFLSDEGLAQLPMRLAAHATGMILSYAYHCHPNEFIKHGVLDDHLVSRILMAAVGFGTPEHEITKEGLDGAIDTEAAYHG